MFQRLGYDVFQVPGISRAWRYELSDRSYLLITDIGGYDLPQPGGPFSGMYLSGRDELVEIVPCLDSARDLFQWVRHIERLAIHRSSVPALKTA